MRGWFWVAWVIECAACSGWAAPQARGDRAEGDQPAPAVTAPGSTGPLRPVPACADQSPAQPVDDAAPPDAGTLRVRFSKRTSSMFRLTCVRLEVDGVARYAMMDPQGDIELAAGDLLASLALAPGRHHLGGQVELVGRCSMIYGYCRGYTFRVRTEREVSLSTGGGSDVELVAFEKGG